MTPGPGITVWPSADDVSFPGVLISDFTRLIPAGAVAAGPLAPTVNMFTGRDGINAAPGGPNLVAGLSSGASVAYDAALGFALWRVVGFAGDGYATLTLKYPRMVVPEGPWRTPALSVPEPSYAVCGFRQSMFLTGNAAVGAAIGCGWVVGGDPLAAGNNWGGGPLANGDNDLVFPTNTRPYVCLIKLNAGLYQVRVRGNDGTSRLYPLNNVIDSTQAHVVDFRVYRATLTSPARYALYINGVLQWSQLMSEGAGPGGESASPTTGGAAIMPFISSQGVNNGQGVRVWDCVVYRGYDLASTTDRA